jgi:hypothetical protein
MELIEGTLGRRLLRMEAGVLPLTVEKGVAGSSLVLRRSGVTKSFSAGILCWKSFSFLPGKGCLAEVPKFSDDFALSSALCKVVPTSACSVLYNSAGSEELVLLGVSFPFLLDDVL